ncbi:hypothetical protein NJB1604_39430 [Mycobacterium marinum]|nr:hypothetical protein NJB1604_39430 [Mycobacterium marinum]
MLGFVNATCVTPMVASVMVLVAGGLPLASAAPAPEAGPCDLPITRDLIIWQRWPWLQDGAFATKVGDVDLVHCEPTLDTWRAGEPTGPGYCSKIAWASDNPDYDVDVRPAPPLKSVIDQVGDC